MTKALSIINERGRSTNGKGRSNLTYNDLRYPKCRERSGNNKKCYLAPGVQTPKNSEISNPGKTSTETNIEKAVQQIGKRVRLARSVGGSLKACGARLT